jgi:hypothetical protein
MTKIEDKVNEILGIEPENKPTLESIVKVESKKRSNTRVSLAFNVFIKGEIGEGKKLTKLIL